MARRQVSILDVARRAGVSTSTVSRSLRGADNVSEGTRHRVLQAAQELAYVPSPAASRLVTGRTRTIAVIVPFASRWFFSEVVSGAENALRVEGYDLLLYNIGDRAGRAHFFESLPLRRRALTEAGIEERRDHIVSEPWGISGGVRAMEHLLSRARLPTAVFAESDEMAFGALQTLRR